MKLKNLWIIAMIVSSLLLLASFSGEAADETITDGIEDVGSVDFITGDTIIVTHSPDIDVDNLDIKEVTYTRQGTKVILTLQVVGIIEDRGGIIDMYNYGGDDFSLIFNDVNYGFTFTTSEQDYVVYYSNQTGQLSIGGGDPKNLTSPDDFSVLGDTLTVSFSLERAEETYEDLSVESTLMKGSLMDVDPENPDSLNFVYLSDIAPNPPLEVYSFVSNIGLVDENIQFNGSVSPFSGQPPYTYHWDFGDGKTSTVQNPTHVYTKTGDFTYNFTVIDHAGDSASETGTITISSEGEGSNGPLSSQMILFLAVLIIIIIIGVVVIVWIIRR